MDQKTPSIEELLDRKFSETAINDSNQFAQFIKGVSSKMFRLQSSERGVYMYSRGESVEMFLSRQPVPAIKITLTTHQRFEKPYVIFQVFVSKLSSLPLPFSDFVLSKYPK